jgi:oxygen-independent coproporphyrinogen-3 oxidase
MKKASSLYIHMPWCLRKCPYCDFNSYGTSRILIPQEKYVDALLRNLTAMSDAYHPDELKTIFIGGGTPSLFDPVIINKLFEGIEQLIHIETDAEITMEINPGTADRKQLEALGGIINRISFGVQSLNDRYLKSLRRIHSANDALSIIKTARSLNFRNINMDIMYGLPGQTISDCIEDLERSLAIEPDHISWYELTIEDDTEFGRNPPQNLPNSDLLADMSEAGIEKLRNAGYERYEISNYCRDGKKCRHNLIYWNFDDYLGIGAGAHAKVSDQETKRIYRIAQPLKPDEYMRSCNFIENAELVSKSDIPFQYFLNRARLMDNRLELTDIVEHTFLSPVEVSDILKSMEKENYVERSSGGMYRITDKGYLYNNDMLISLLPD